MLRKLIAQLLCISMLLLGSTLACAADAVKIPSGDLRISNGDIRLPTSGSGIVFSDSSVMSKLSDAAGIQGPKGDKGDTGSQGLQGPQGPQGIPGPSGGITGTQIVQSSASSTKLVDSQVNCPAGMVVLGGGVAKNNRGSGNAILTDSYPCSMVSWCGKGVNMGGLSGTFSAFNMTTFAICAANTGTPVGTPRIVFDYSYDTNGFFTTARRAIMESVAAIFTSRIGFTKWEKVDPATSGGSYDLAFINPSTIGVSWQPNVIIPENQITIYLGATDFTQSPIVMMRGSEGTGATQLLSIRNLSGGVGTLLGSSSQFRPVDASISFDLQGIQGFSPTRTRQWHFDADGDFSTDDRNLTDPRYNDYDDFYTAAIHEVGHVLGIYNPNVFRTIIEADVNFGRAYVSQIVSDGAGGYVFTGPYAKAMYFNHVGQNIPLELNTLCHFADGVRSQTSDGWTSLSYESGQPFRHSFSELEFQLLRDIGYTITPSP